MLSTKFSTNVNAQLKETNITLEYKESMEVGGFQINEDTDINNLIYQNGMKIGVASLKHSDGTFQWAILASKADENKWSIYSKIGKKISFEPTSSKLRYLNGIYILEAYSYYKTSEFDDFGSQIWKYEGGQYLSKNIVNWELLKEDEERFFEDYYEIDWKRKKLGLDDLFDIVEHEGKYWAIGSDTIIYQSNDLKVWDKVTSAAPEDEIRQMLGGTMGNKIKTDGKYLYAIVNSQSAVGPSFEHLNIYDLKTKKWSGRKTISNIVSIQGIYLRDGEIIVSGMSSSDYHFPKPGSGVKFYSSKDLETWAELKNDDKAFIETIKKERTRDSSVERDLNLMGLKGKDLFTSSNVVNPIENSLVKVTIDGRYIDFDQSPIIENGATLLPLRKIFEELGLELVWEQKTQTIRAEKNGINIVMVVGEKHAMVNGTKVNLSVPSKILNGRTLVPARFIAESFGADVKWDDESRTVIIKQ